MNENDVNQQQLSKKDAFMGKMRERYPDRNFDDEEELYGAIGDDYAAHDEAVKGYDEQIAGYQSNEQKLAEMFAANPKMAVFLNDVRDGADPIVKIVELLGSDIVERIDDPEFKEELAAANQKHLDELAANNQLEAEYNQNLADSAGEMRAFQQEENLQDEDLDNVMQFYAAVADAAIRGVYKKDVMKALLRAMHYEDDVQAANDEGEIRGRNAKIEAQMRQPEQTDSMPQLGGQASGMGQQGEEEDIFDLANSAR